MELLVSRWLHQQLDLGYSVRIRLYVPVTGKVNRKVSLVLLLVGTKLFSTIEQKIRSCVEYQYRCVRFCNFYTFSGTWFNYRLGRVVGASEFV